MVEVHLHRSGRGRGGGGSDVIGNLYKLSRCVLNHLKLELNFVNVNYFFELQTNFETGN